jgi:hypothetical protein
MKNGLPPLRKEFWDVNKRLLKISLTGSIYFTDEGKMEYRSLFSRHGYYLEHVTTLEDFRRVTQDITALQMSLTREELLRLLHDPNTSRLERAALAALAGIDPPPVAAPAPTGAIVISLSDWRVRQRNA